MRYNRDMPSTAYDRFIASMTMDYEKWHDGIGYDLDALKQVTPAERQSLVKVLRSREITWREIEALEAIGGREALAVIKSATKSTDRTTRLAALEALQSSSGKKNLDDTLPDEIRQLTTISDGLTATLLLAEQYPTPKVKEALLRASWNPTEASMHCAALLAYLCGKAKDPFDWNLRPMFLRLAPGNSHGERKKAFDELCALVGMQLDTWQ